MNLKIKYVLPSQNELEWDTADGRDRYKDSRGRDRERGRHPGQEQQQYQHHHDPMMPNYGGNQYHN